MSETELLKAFRENQSEEAFARLVCRYAGLVYSVAKRRLGNAALAEDITQIVFIRFAKTPPKVKSSAELAAWLHRTTLNVAINTWRSETRRRAREQESIFMESMTAENVVWEELSPKLDEALNQLSDDDRQSLLLRFFSQKTMRDIGTALGVGEDAAKMRVSRAVGRLRTQLVLRSSTCTVTVLGTLLAEHSVEAAPAHLVARLSAIKLPQAVGMVGLAGLIGALLRIPKFNLAAGATVLVVVGVSLIQMLRSLSAPATNPALMESTTPSTDYVSRGAEPETFRSRPAAGSFNAPAAAPPANVKILFHVLDAETDEPLAGTKIRVAFFGAGGQGESHDLLTDISGTAAIPEPDDVSKNEGPNVFVVAEGHVPKVVGFRDTVPTDYVIKLDPALPAGGLVVDEQGLPVAGVEIKIQGPGNKRGQMENVDFQNCPVTNHLDGSWSCSYLPRDYTEEIRFILKKAGYEVTFPVVPVGVDLTNLVLVINRGFTVAGRIIDAQNQPVARAQINTLYGDSNKRQSVTTDENGDFTLAGLPGDTLYYQEPPLKTNDGGGIIIRGLAGEGPLHVELAVQATGFSPQTAKVDLLTTTNVANFTLLQGNIFRGRVVDESGKPIARTVVRTDYDFKNQIETRFDWTAHTDESGWFEWDSAPAEAICYWFESNGYAVIRGMSMLADGSYHTITLTRPTAQ